MSQRASIENGANTSGIAIGNAHTASAAAAHWIGSRTPAFRSRKSSTNPSAANMPPPPSTAQTNGSWPILLAVHASTGSAIATPPSVGVGTSCELRAFGIASIEERRVSAIKSAVRTAVTAAAPTASINVAFATSG